MKVAIRIYAVLIVLFAIYGSLWGEMSHRGFAYNLGRAFVWPTILFPSVGAAIGGLVILALVAAVTLRRKA